METVRRLSLFSPLRLSIAGRRARARYAGRLRQPRRVPKRAVTGATSFAQLPYPSAATVGARPGSQLSLQSAELARPLIAMLFGSIDAAIRRYVAQLDGGSDPLRTRNSGAAALTGAWSVRLRSGGHHADHVHPHGWLSSACYIALPPTLGNGTSAPSGHAGWLRFGRPGSQDSAAARRRPLHQAATGVAGASSGVHVARCRAV